MSEINLSEITVTLDSLKDARARLKFDLKAVEDEIEKQELKLIAQLSNMDVDRMDYGVYSFGWKTTERKAFDQKLFAEKHPNLFESFKITKESKKFEFKINK